VFFYPEVPYDYGAQGLRNPLGGVIATKCQPGAKTFQDGLGVNMRGEVVVESNIYYVPRMEEEGWTFGAAGILERTKRGEYSDAKWGNYAAVDKRDSGQREARGRGVLHPAATRGPLAGATAWTYDRTGELRQGPAVVAGKLFGGVQMDEDGFIYFANSRQKLVGDKPFLAGKAGLNGSQDRTDPFTGTLIKTKGKAKFLSMKATVPLPEPPGRPPDLCGGYGEDSRLWVEVPSGCMPGRTARGRRLLVSLQPHPPRLVQARVRAGVVPALDRHSGHERESDHASGPVRQLRRRAGRQERVQPAGRMSESCWSASSPAPTTTWSSMTGARRSWS